jgi:hypothetical protein
MDTVIGAVPSQGLCLVTVDTAANQNVVVWEKADKYATDSFYIYRANTPDTVYAQIAALGRDSLSAFYDATSQPDNNSYRYKINLKDTCGNFSALSDYHQTILLQSLGSGNFAWTPYVIENTASPVNTYDFYRDSSGNGNWQLLANVPSPQTTASDADYQLYPNARYVIIVTLANPCNPTRSISTITSNVLAQTTITKIDNVFLQNIKLLYNPVHSQIVLINITQPVTLQIVDALGQILQSGIHAVGSSAVIDVSRYAAGIYYVKVMEHSYSRTFVVGKD